MTGFGVLSTTQERFDELVALHEQCRVERVSPPVIRWFGLRRYCPVCGRRVKTSTVKLCLLGMAILTQGLVDLTECLCGYRHAFGYSHFVD